MTLNHALATAQAMLLIAGGSALSSCITGYPIGGPPTVTHGPAPQQAKVARHVGPTLNGQTCNPGEAILLYTGVVKELPGRACIHPIGQFQRQCPEPGNTMGVKCPDGTCALCIDAPKNAATCPGNMGLAVYFGAVDVFPGFCASNIGSETFCPPQDKHVHLQCAPGAACGACVGSPGQAQPTSPPASGTPRAGRTVVATGENAPGGRTTSSPTTAARVTTVNEPLRTPIAGTVGDLIEVVVIAAGTTQARQTFVRGGSIRNGQLEWTTESLAADEANPPGEAFGIVQYRISNRDTHPVSIKYTDFHLMVDGEGKAITGEGLIDSGPVFGFGIGYKLGAGESRTDRIITVLPKDRPDQATLQYRELPAISVRFGKKVPATELRRSGVSRNSR